MNYDLVIPAAPKDYNKVKFCITSAVKHLYPTPVGIYVVSPAKTHSMRCVNREVHWINEQEVLGLDPLAAKNFNRPQWIYAMFLKMFQDYTPNQQYLVVDSDLIFNRPFNVYSEQQKPQFFLGVDQNHTPYFNFSEQYLGFGREYPYSFISEIMLFDKSISEEIADICGGVEKFYELATRVACQWCIPADYEIYGNYVYKFHPHAYELINIKTSLHGKFQEEWGDKEIVELQAKMQNEPIDTFTYHTWI